MSWILDNLKRLKTPQWILIAAALLGGLGAVFVGISDNPLGIALILIAVACLTGAWVWNWVIPRRFWRLLAFSLLGFPVGVVLHNLLYALGTMVDDIQILYSIVGFLGAVFFILAVIVVGPVSVVALLGGIYTSWRGMKGYVKANRSYRRFKESYQIKEEKLWKLIDLARLSSSSANRQPLKFVISNTDQMNQAIFPALSWAGYLKDWDGPEEGERPSAYIVLLGDTDLANSFEYDAGIACQSITLGAVEMGLGCCLIGSVKSNQLREALQIPDKYQILLVIAVGLPVEEVILEEVDPDGDIKYWRDDQGRHHVPKRNLADVILDL